MKIPKIIDNNGRCLIQFQYRGRRYSLTHGDYSNKIDRSQMEYIAQQIYLDCNTGNFDFSMDKYRPWGKKESSTEKPELALLEVWDKWVEFLKLPEATKVRDYDSIRRIIEARSPSAQDAFWLLQMKWAPSVFNKRLAYCRSCVQWAMREGLVEDNPFNNVRAKKKEQPKIEPFSREEANRIVTFFSNGLTPDSVFHEKFLVYGPLVRFLFLTGLRPGEALGLQWWDIDFTQGIIKIRRSITTNNTSNPNYGVPKRTKTGESWIIPLTVQLRTLFKEVQESRDGVMQARDYLFRSPEGGLLNWNNFRVRIWGEALALLDIPYRYPYQIRHTVLSHAASDPKIGLMGAAQIAGHKNTSMVSQHYARYVNKPRLPDIIE